MFVSVESQLFHTTSQGQRSDIAARLAREGEMRGEIWRFGRTFVWRNFS